MKLSNTKGGQSNMIKKYLKSILLLMFGAVIAGGIYSGAAPQNVFAANLEMAESQELSVDFQEEYPEVGKDLHIIVGGLETDESCTYTWKVADRVAAQGEVYRPVSGDLEKFITVVVNTSKGRSAERSVYFSKLPVVYIDTNNVPIVDKENYVKGNLFIQGNEKFNSTNTTLYDGELEIRGRGNSSWEAPKKPYRIKLGSKADIFGMGANKHWTLLANYYDPSLSRNKLSYDFSGELGLVSMDSENVILIMNGVYQGVYQFCEHIRIDKTRINITDWEKIAEDTAETISDEEGIDNGDLEDYLVENMSWITNKEFEFGDKTYYLEDYEIELPDIDGGYLLELDKNLDEVSSFYSSHNQPLMFKSPEYVKNNSDMLQYVKDYVNAFEAAINTSDGYTTYEGKEVHYSELYDMDALAQYFLITELFFNTDGMKKSTYMYKDNNELMKMGPIWDMDWCAGNPYEQSSPSDRWQTLFYDDEMVSEQWYRSMVGDPYFAYKVKNLYDSNRASIESFVSENGRIDENVDYLKEAGIKNDARWNTNNTGFVQNTENFKAWMIKRISWLDEQMVSLDNLLKSWGTFNSNQEGDTVIAIEEITATEDGVKISVLTESSEEVVVYINGIKYAEKAAVDKQAEVLIPYDSLKDKDMQEIFVVVRTMHQGKICTAYKDAETKLPGETPEPKPEQHVDIDDAVTTVTGEAFKFEYAPGSRWHAEAGYQDLFYNGTDHYSDFSDTGADKDCYTMKFSGTGIAIYGSLNKNHAVCEVFIDGNKAGEINAQPTDASNTTVHKQMLFEKKNLDNGEHVLKVIRKDGETNALQVDKIRVYYEELTVSSISLNVDTVRLGVGETKQMDVSIEPWVAENPNIEWISSDENVATVNTEGLITAMATTLSETVITATVKGTDVSAQVKVIVDPAAEIVSVNVGNEKILETQNDYEKLVDAETVDTWNGTAWKGDVLNSKIIIASKNQQLNHVTVTPGAFSTSDGKVISADNISIKWLKEIEANDGRNMAGTVNSYPDIIHQGGSITIPKEAVKFAWISIAVPESSEEGIYTGTVTVDADEIVTPITLTYTLEVLNLVQPAPEATEVQIWQHPFAAANYYLGLGAVSTDGVSYEANEDFYFTEQHFNLMRASMEEYVSMGGHDLVANIVEEAWNHQSYYNDPSMVKWTKKTDGSWKFDYTWYDAWVEFAIECGVINPEKGIGQIKCYSIVPWNNQIAYYDETKGVVVKESHTPGDAAWETLWVPFLEDFMAHSKEKGWFDITYISMDERSLEQLEPTVDLVESITDENGEHFKISSALNYAAPQYYDFTDRIHDISINLGNCQDQVQMNALADHRRLLGLKTTYYTCTGNYPGNFVISDPGDNYWQLWYSMTLGMDGFMRWAWDNFVYDMHGNVSYRYWEPGDGWYFYPTERDEIGENYEAGFYSTPRYELFKQGVRDVAKAKYLMEQSDALAQEIDELMATLTYPNQAYYHGSAVPVNETQRLLLHSETDRIYKVVTELAKAYIESIADEPENENEIVRLFGQGRYDTAYAVADELKNVLGVEKFEAVVVATGQNFADALAGSYLAVQKNAPILLTNGKTDNVAQLHKYINENVEVGGTVYILGGEGAVPKNVDGIKGYTVKRLFGNSRYDTNLEILAEAGMEGDSIIVATGKTFADSLSASAVNLPILLVKPNGTLNDAQKAVLEGIKNIYIIGGESAVSESYAAELAAYGEVTRVFGQSRYDTSVEVAKTFFDDVDKAVAASGKNFPDGLCGGPLAAALDAPLVLTLDGKTAAAESYVAENAVASGYVLGGNGALTDDAVVTVFGLESADEIITR